MTQLTQSEVAMAAAIAAQSEATASLGVADSTLADSKANPTDADLLKSVEATRAEAVKDQLNADELLAKAVAFEKEEAASIVSAAPKVVEVSSAPVVKPVVVAPAPIPKATNLASQATVHTNDFASYIAKTKLTGTHTERAFISQIEDYVAKMKPGQIVTPEEGANHQLNLWRLIKTTLANATGEFNTLFGMLLGYAYAHKNGVFHDRYIFRFSENFTFNPEEIQAFQAILNLVNVTCIPGDRKALLRQVDLHRTLAVYFDEPTRQRVVAFYK